MRVDLQQAAHRMDARPRAEGREAAIADLRQGRHEDRRDAVPGRHHAPAARARRTAVPAPSSRCRARPARSWPAAAGRARSSSPAQRHDWCGRSRAAAGRRRARRARRSASAAVALRRHDRQRQRHRVSRDDARAGDRAPGPASTASSSRHHSSAVRPASRQRASFVVERLPAAHGATICFRAATVAGRAARIDRREAADRRTGPGLVDRPPPGVAGDEIVGRARQRTMPRSTSTRGAVGLLGLARRAERHQHGAIGMAERLDHGVVAGLRDRERRVAQQGREVGTRRLDDDAVARRRRERRAFGVRHVRPDQQAPACDRPAASAAARRWRRAAAARRRRRRPPTRSPRPCRPSPVGARAASDSAT